MKCLWTSLTTGMLSLCAAAALATPPKQLITHNTTNVESNAFIDGTLPSSHPTHPHSDGKVFWGEVQIACFGHLSADRKCSALIVMASNTDTPIKIGTLAMDVDTGDITPKQLSANGYTITVNGPGETTLSTD